MNIKKILVVAITVCMLISSLSLVSFAAGDASKNILSLDYYVETFVDEDNDGLLDKDEDVFVKQISPTDKVFVGEYVKAVLSFEKSESFKGYDTILSYDNSVVQLASFTDGTVVESDDVLKISAENGIELSTSPKFSPLKSMVAPAYGYIMHSGILQNPVVMTEKTALYTINFKVMADGVPNIRFATDTDDGELVYDIFDYDMISNKSGVKFAFNNIALELNTAVNSFDAYAQPNDPSALLWEEYTGKWEAPAETGCRGYIVELLYNGSSVMVNEGVAATNYNFLSDIKNNGAGTYVFKVTAIGGDNNSNAIASATLDVQGIILDSPSDLTYDQENGNLSWEPVDDAAGYTVEIYVEGSDTPAKTYSGVTDTNINIGNDVNVGDYIIKVKADSDNSLYIDSDYSSVTYNSGSHIYGSLKYLVHDDSLELNYIDTFVVLSDGTNNIPGKVSATGEFDFYNVPAGTYTVTISREGGIERTLQKAVPGTSPTKYESATIELTKSINKKISKDDGIQIYLGDLDGDAGVGLLDLTEIVELIGTVKTDNVYRPVADFFKDVSNSIEVDEMQLIIQNYSAGPRSYRSFADFDLTVQ